MVEKERVLVSCQGQEAFGTFGGCLTSLQSLNFPNAEKRHKIE